MAAVWPKMKIYTRVSDGELDSEISVEAAVSAARPILPNLKK
jgi:hypothetical protein